MILGPNDAGLICGKYGKCQSPRPKCQLTFPFCDKIEKKRFKTKKSKVYKLSATRIFVSEFSSREKMVVLTLLEDDDLESKGKFCQI